MCVLCPVSLATLVHTHALLSKVRALNQSRKVGRDDGVAYCCDECSVLSPYIGNYRLVQVSLLSIHSVFEDTEVSLSCIMQVVRHAEGLISASQYRWGGSGVVLLAALGKMRLRGTASYFL